MCNVFCEASVKIISARQRTNAWQINNLKDCSFLEKARFLLFTDVHFLLFVSLLRIPYSNPSLTP